MRSVMGWHRIERNPCLLLLADRLAATQANATCWRCCCCSCCCWASAPCKLVACSSQPVLTTSSAAYSRRVNIWLLQRSPQGQNSCTGPAGHTRIQMHRCLCTASGASGRRCIGRPQMPLLPSCLLHCWELAQLLLQGPSKPGTQQLRATQRHAVAENICMLRATEVPAAV